MRPSPTSSPRSQLGMNRSLNVSLFSDQVPLLEGLRTYDLRFSFASLKSREPQDDASFPTTKFLCKKSSRKSVTRNNYVKVKH